jgi:hypothetical protein
LIPQSRLEKHCMGVIELERRIYAPPVDEMTWRSERYEAYREERGPGLMMYGVMGAVVLAIGGFSWNLYAGSGEPPLVRAPKGEFKTLAAEPQPAEANREVFDVIEGETRPQSVPGAAPEAQEPPAAQATATDISLSILAPRITSSGAYMVQLAALRSEESAREAWRVFSSQAPALARDAKVEIQRADMGPQGVFFRLRAGFFTARSDAAAYCEAAAKAQQDCMVVAR